MRKLTYDKTVITCEAIQSLREQGLSYTKIAQRFGVTDQTIKRACIDYGIIPDPKRRAKKFTDVSEQYKESHKDQFSRFLELHEQGLSYQQIAAACGCSQAQVGKLFTIYGYSFDTAYKTKAAHEAVRGMKRTEEDLFRRALGKEARPPRLSRWEVLFKDFLSAQDVPFTISKAIGKYNVDFAIGDSVAVELFGGAFHAMGRAAARVNERMEYILGSGWNVYIIWCLSNEMDISPRCLDDFITFYQMAGRDKPLFGQYRVIWSDGNLVSCGSRESDYLSAIKPPRFRHDALRKNKATRD